MTLKGDEIFLRALEPEDLDFLFEIENNEEFWEVSATSVPFSRYILKQYLENSHKDIYEVKQLRLVISTHNGETVGLIDIFDFDPKNRRAALGILIAPLKYRNKGYGAEALNLVAKYCFAHLGLHQVYANVGEDNTSSRILFEKSGFILSANKKDWNLVNGEYKAELTYQLLNLKHVHQKNSSYHSFTWYFRFGRFLILYL
ncbi:GNAT family N-acetyltransferase [Salinimicrobium oceani]|uniref:GNAT family N-acetyltransferase n=1 Tax=Salinimicrobium oceani TaxID=2722702 RepID=UPI00293BD88B|nr:GNAT family N-acetyltransferase [Salinimicrobium oceani]